MIPHCGKCQHLKRKKPFNIRDKKGRILAEGAHSFCQSLGAYFCPATGQWWSYRPTKEGKDCHSFLHIHDR